MTCSYSILSNYHDKLLLLEERRRFLELEMQLTEMESLENDNVLSVDEIRKWKVDTYCDVRDTVGRFCSAVIIAKKGGEDFQQDSL